MGEMLAELRIEPRTTEELRQTAGRYGLTWDRRDQIARRRRWLQSAQLVKQTNTGRLAITDAGIELLTKLELHQPPENPTSPRPFAIPPPPATLLKAGTPTTPQPDVPRPDEPITDRSDTPAEALAAEIRSASTDSKNPDRLEFAIRDAFQFLGFDAEKLGGSSKTDVLVKALLGKDDSYSATIDAKTVGAGSLGDGQVDWVTLDEHKKLHGADYSMLVGPNPSGKRLMNRAIDQGVAVLSTDQLAELCLQHADAPLGLQDYRSLFEAGGAVDMTPISRSAQELSRIRDLAAELCAKLAERTSTFGPLTSSQLMVILDQPDKPSSAKDIQQVLDTLANPLISAVKGTASEGYVLATAPRVMQLRLQQLGDQLAALESA